MASSKTPPASFSFRPAFAERAKKELAKYPPSRKQSAVLALLDLAQRQNSETNCVTDAAMDSIAKMLEISRMRLEEIASFYTMIHRKPIGKYHVQCCTTTPCMLRGSDSLVAAAEQKLGIRIGESTSDGLFTLSRVECIGACANAPAVQINDDFYEDLSKEHIEKILDNLAAGKPVTAGSQIMRRGAEPMGRSETGINKRSDYEMS